LGINLADLENDFEVHIITQNVDDLHERAGSSNVHLHGELLKVRSVADYKTIIDWKEDLVLGDVDAQNRQLPHIVWFGEEVPALEEAALLQPLIFLQ
jgi:NAD-dependent deacetylase